MRLIKVVSPAQAGRIIDRRLAGIEKRGFTGRAALARLVRPGNIAASFGGGSILEAGAAPQVTKVNPLVAELGIKMIAIPAGKFIYQGGKISGHGFKIAETEFTNGQFRKLLESKPKELAGILENPQERLEKSLKIAADPTEAEDCPMVYLSQTESEGIAKLLGGRLLTEREWERAAAGTRGRIYSFGEDFNENKATFNDEGTRSVYAHRDASTPEGVMDLSGNVWEWTSSNEGNYRVLRGGSGGSNDSGALQAADRSVNRPGGQDSFIGFRFAEDI